VAVLDAFPANSKDQNIKHIQGGISPEPPSLSPPSHWYYLALSHFRVQPFAPLFSSI